MPAIRSSINHRNLPVPRVQGYSVLTDNNEDSVFTRLDLPLADRREVIPYLSAEYPSRDEVCYLLLPIPSLSDFIIDRNSDQYGPDAWCQPW